MFVSSLVKTPTTVYAALEALLTPAKSPTEFTIAVKHLFLASLLLLVAAFPAACAAPAIGDPCKDAYDCDTNGNRYCDRTQPGGYCIVGGCEKSTCPEDSVCVMFRPTSDRLAVTWCMATCDETSDCRDRYICRRADQLIESPSKEPTALNLDRESAKFCTARPSD